MGFVTQDEIESALKTQQQSGGKLGEILVKLKSCDSEQVAKALAYQFDLQYCQLSKFEIPPEVIELVPKNIALENKIVPLKKGKRDLVVATSDPALASDFVQLDNLRFLLGQDVRTVLASQDSITEAIGKYYGEAVGLEERMAELTEANLEVKGEAAAGEERESL